MELIKKNIHMDRIKCRANTQITLEDDRNVPDNRPDMERLILSRGEVAVTEIKATEDHAEIKGRLDFTVLYLPEDGDEGLCRMEGSLPFEEQVYMEGLENGDSIQVRWETEDMNIGLINSRKLSVQAVISLRLSVEELYDEETAVELYQEEPVECRKKTLTLAETAIQKKDIFRIKEELEMPQNFPNIFRLIWEDIRPGNVECRAMEEKLSIQGEVNVFFLYEGEGEEQPLKWYETTLPFSGTIDCHGCREDMIPDIFCEAGHKDVEVRADFDGEERIIGLDIALDMDIKLYAEEQVDILADVYGVTKEVQTEKRMGTYNNLLARCSGKMKITERGKIKSGSPRMLQICHSQGEIKVDSFLPVENGIDITGTVEITVLYMTGEEIPYASFRETVPFQYVLEVPGMEADCRFNLETILEQLSVSMIDSEEMDIKGVLHFRAVIFRNVAEEVITDVIVQELNPDILNDLPGMVAYVAAEGEDLWQLGKKYYVPIDRIKEMNHLTGDVLKAGDKLLIVR